MKTRVLLFVIFSLFLFSLGSLITVIFNTVPTTAGALTLFYVLLFIDLAGATFLISYGFLRLKYQAVPPWSSTGTALRLSAGLALYVSLLLLLKAQELLNAGTTLLLLIVIVILQLYGRRLNFEKNS